MSQPFDENRSVWLAGKPPYEPSPPLDRDLDVDVAIIGGGFTGVSAAYHLSKRFPDLGLALVEAKALGNGASGRNGGQMLNWIFGVETERGEEARRIYEATREGIDGILAIIAEHGLDVPHRRDGHLDVLTQARSAERAARTVEALREAGLPLEFLGPDELPEHVALEGAAGAVLDPGGGQLDGVALLRGLRPVLESRGVHLFESTPVSRVREAERVELETPRGRVRARSLVLATNAYTPHLGYFGDRLVALHSHVIATERRSPEEWSRLGWRRHAGFTDDRGRLAYGTLSSEGRLVFGGGSNATYDYVFGNGTAFTHSAERAYRACRAHLLDYLPGVREVPITHRWSGPVALTLSRVCSMGVRGERRNIFYALGYSGHGVTLANLAGRVITDLYAGSEERWRGLPFLDRRLGFIPPEPVRWIGYQVYTRLTGRSPSVSV